MAGTSRAHKPSTTPAHTGTILDPIEWVRTVMDDKYNLLRIPSPDSSEARAVCNDLILSARTILGRHEDEQLAAMSDEDLAAAFSKADASPRVKDEIIKRLTAKPAPAPVAAPTPIDSGQHSFVLPKGYHVTTGPSLPAGGIPCNCIRGEDHDEAFFEVPIGGAPRVTEQQEESKTA